MVSSFPNESRSVETVLVSGTIPDSDPAIIDIGSVQTGKEFIDIKILASGVGESSVGEVMLASLFESPREPSIRVETVYVPQRNFINLPNGERRSIKHGGVPRKKRYTIPGLTLDQAQLWIDLFQGNEGSRLVVLLDEEGDTYPAYMNQELTVNRETTVISIALDFTEIKLE